MSDPTGFRARIVFIISPAAVATARRHSSAKATIELITQEVGSKYHQEARELYVAKKKPVFARKASIYLAKRLTCLTNVEIGNKFGITYSAVSKAAGDIERLRQEDNNVNREVEEIISHFKG